jgi:hypothetical protein
MHRALASKGRGMYIHMYTYLHVSIEQAAEAGVHSATKTAQRPSPAAGSEPVLDSTNTHGTSASQLHPTSSLRRDPEITIRRRSGVLPPHCRRRRLLAFLPISSPTFPAERLQRLIEPTLHALLTRYSPPQPSARLPKKPRCTTVSVQNNVSVCVLSWA